MKRFSISQLERFSDIKPHTIRTWENRYGLLNPERSAGNTRYYTLDDLERLLDISLLNQYGGKIKKLSILSNEELKVLAARLGTPWAKFQNSLNRLIISLYKSDIEQFECILDDIARNAGMPDTIKHLIVPFLEKTDILSYKDSAVEIHFAVTAIRKKLLVGIDQAKPETNKKRKAVLFLPEGEHYDLILLIMYYCLKCEGVMVYYLGTNISQNNLESIILSKSPNELFVYTVSPKKYHFETLNMFLDHSSPLTMLTIVTADQITENHSNRVKFTHYSSFLAAKR